jgi:hypothetical protein
LITVVGEGAPLVFGDLDPTFTWCRDIRSSDDIAGVEVAEDGVADAGAGADVEGAGEDGERRRTEDRRRRIGWIDWRRIWWGW